MGILSSFNTSATGLTAQRLRMSVIANNLANIDTTRTPSGDPYRRQFVIFESILAKAGEVRTLKEEHLPRSLGVAVSGIIEDTSSPRLVYEPGHPDANEEGYVAFPNIDPVTEMVDMISATRAYEANVTAINSAKTMAMRALEIGRA